MNMQELKELIYQGEKVDIECKKAEKNVPKSAYESYSAFANTKGGVLALLPQRKKQPAPKNKRSFHSLKNTDMKINKDLVDATMMLSFIILVLIGTSDFYEKRRNAL